MSKYEEFDKYEHLIKQLLSKKRYNHSMCVAEECYKLAERYGADKKRCYLAGLLHDVMKEEKSEKQRQYTVESGLSPDPAEVATKSLWHAVAGAYYVREELGIDDAEVISAIRYHTVGCARMTLLEKIVFLGDMISNDRDYKDVDKMRDYCYKDIDVAMSVALAYYLTDISEKCGFLCASTFEAYNYYLRFNENKEHL